MKKLEYDIRSDEVVFQNRLGFAFVFDSLNRKSKKELIKRLIDTIEIKRDKNYNIEITNIKFTETFCFKLSEEEVKNLKKQTTILNLDQENNWSQIATSSKSENSKHRGKKCFAINKIEDVEIIEKIINL